MNKSTTTKPMQASSNISGTGDIVHQAKQTASDVASQAKEGVSHRIDDQKHKAVEKIETVSSALRGAGKELEGTGPLPDLAEKAAEGIERLAHYFETRSVNELVGSFERFARREPALFLGGAVALGMLAGRFLKSSSRRMSSPAYPLGGEDISDRYETYGYEGEYTDDFLSADDLQDDWDTTSEPMAFEAEDRGIGAGFSGGVSGGVQQGIGNVMAEEPLRATQPQGSSEGSVGIGSTSRGTTEKMPSFGLGKTDSNKPGRP